MIIFGGIDPIYFTGGIQWIPVLQTTGYWQIAVTRYRGGVNDQLLNHESFISVSDTTCKINLISQNESSHVPTMVVYIRHWVVSAFKI